MSAPNLTVNDDQMNVPELGDIITLKSTVFKSLTGKIVYRDERLIRVVPIDASDRAYEFGMDQDDGDFVKETGITECIIHSKRDQPNYSLQLGVAVGETLEFFNNVGQVAAVPGVVSHINADDDKDSIQLADGRILDFMFIGPPLPIQVIRVGALAEITQAEAPVSTEENDDEELPEKYDLSFLEGLIPAATMEEIPTADRTYPEIIQREEMYIDLLKSYPESKHKNPNLLRSIARQTDLLLALKNAVTVFNEKGETRPYLKSANSLKDILENIGAPLSSLVPVLALKRILYTDVESPDKLNEEILDQVEFRDWITCELRSCRTSESYLAGQDGGAAAQVSKLLYTYLYDILYREGAVFQPSDKSREGEEIFADQEVLRTVLPPEPVFGFSKFKADASLNNAFVGPLNTRLHRVISSSKTRNHNVIAPGDPGTATNYLLFTAESGSALRPTKYSGTLSEDIRAANFVSSLPSIEYLTNDERAYTPNGIQVIKGVNTATAEGLDASEINVSAWITDNLKKSVHPSDTLSTESIGVNRVLDAIGLRSYEWTPEVSKELWTAVGKSQTMYNRLFNAYKADVDKYLLTAKPYNLLPGIAEDSILYKKSMEVPEIAALIAKVGGEGANDLVKAQKIMSTAEGTAARILYLATTDEKHPLLDSLRKTYLSEVHRAAVRFNTVNGELAKLKATPFINKCPHVRDMDVLRSLMKSDNPKFYAILERILTQYQGKRDNNWVDCKVCEGHLICIHEVMLLYERTHPGRAPALHKEILMDYGGAAFSGRYVCRFCGIAISEFEYDTHLEYDDEGRPLVGRNVLEEDNSIEDELDVILNVSVKKKGIMFENEIQTNIYSVTRTFIQTAGFTFDEEIYRSIVMFVYGYLITELPAADKYQLMIAKKKVKPSYDSFKATNAIAVIAAYTLCLIHSMKPVPDIMFTFTGCHFKRGGYPIENDDAESLGAMEYFVCVIANINRDSEPWNLCMWSTESSPEKRKDMVRNWIMNMLQTKDLRVLAAKARSDYILNVKDTQGRASSRDKIPWRFRPTPNSKPAHFDSEVMVHPDRILESSLKDTLANVQPILDQRIYQLACESVKHAHEEALGSGIISETNPRSDSNCCFTSLQKIKETGSAIFNSPAMENEIIVLKNAETIIQRRNPGEQSNGAHLYVHWSTPEAIQSIPVKPDASYFKLFMRTCFRGKRLGLIHEFGQRGKIYQCRHCNFKLDRDPLVLMSDLNDEEILNNNRKGGAPIISIQSMARESLRANGIEVKAETFRELLSAVRSKRIVEPFIEPPSMTSSEMFDMLNRLVNTDLPFMMVRNVDWQLVVEIMDDLLKRKDEPSEEARAIIWVPFVTRYDSLKAGLKDILDGRQGRGGTVKKVSRDVEKVIEAVERLTEEPMYQGPNEINKHWIVGLERLAQGFSEMVFGAGTWFGQNVGNAKPIQNYLFNGKKWFGKKISQRHTEKFETMIQNILGANTDTNKELGRPEIRAFSSAITHRLSIYLGRIIQFWTTEMASFSVFGVTKDEMRLLLRWLVFSSIETLLLTESPLYSSVPRDSERTQIQRILLNWTKNSLIEGRRQFDLFGLTADEIQMAILDAREKEKLSVIKEIDDEKDPDLRAVAMIQKSLKMGRWAVGTAKNLTSYNAEFQDFLQEQRDRAGIADNGIMKPKKEDALGFDMSNVEASAYDTSVFEHEDVEGGDE
jgi:hypothetical protein